MAHWIVREDRSEKCRWMKEADNMAWTLIVVAGFFEIVWATLLKFTDGFTRMWPSIGTVVAMGISMVCMSFALRTIPMGTAYVVWTGIGAVGTVILGIVLFDEPKNVVRLVCIGMIIAGIAGLKLSSAS
jgi:quaternary ammonium compound-resistance protein SugE